jgi:hypothetical protein
MSIIDKLRDIWFSDTVTDLLILGGLVLIVVGFLVA